MMTFLSTANINADKACPKATLMFCRVIWMKNITLPIKKSGAFATTIFSTSLVAEKSLA